MLGSVAVCVVDTKEWYAVFNATRTRTNLAVKRRHNQRRCESAQRLTKQTPGFLVGKRLIGPLDFDQQTIDHPLQTFPR